MSTYEVIITRGAPSEAFVITGHGALSQSIDFLDSAAKRGELAGFAEIRLYDEVQVPGSLVIALLTQLDQSHTWVERDRTYTVYLSEI